MVGLIILLLIFHGTAYADVASWYGGGERLNEYTASGRKFNPTEMGCASWHYPLKSRIRVTNVANGKSIIVTVYDKGPSKRLGRKIDLYREAFKEIADLDDGLINVRIKKYD